MADLQRRDIGLISLTDAINTASARGRLVLNLFASLAEFERELIHERTLSGGLVAARTRGRIGGRKPGLSEEAQRTARVVELLYKARELSVDDMARSLRICKATFYKYLHHRGMALHAQPFATELARLEFLFGLYQQFSVPVLGAAPKSPRAKKIPVNRP